MKTLLLVLILFLVSCEKETFENFTLEVWKDNGILHIDYHSEIKGFTIWVSPDENHEDSRTQKFTQHSYGCDQSTSYFWTPTYVTMENSEASKTIKV